MTLQVIVSSRGLYPVETYVGDRGQIFYNEVVGDLRISDGGTPGGIRLTFPATFESSTITNQPELTFNEYDSGDFLLIYDSSTGSLKKASLATLLSQGAVGYTGSKGDPGVGITNIAIEDNSLIIDLSTGDSLNLGNVVGYTGSQGPQGYTGSAGTGGASNLVFAEDGNARILSQYRDDDGETYPVRTAELTNGVFKLNLASFTPVLTTTARPSANLSWDVACTGFSVSVTNPTDFLTQYVSSVASVVPLSGSISTDLSLYTTSGPSTTPAPGVSWNQIYTTAGSSFIRSSSTTSAGGSASARINFAVYDEDTQTESAYSGTGPIWTVTWATPTVSVTLTDLSGNSFLKSYASTNYSISVTGMASAINYSLSVTGVGGTPSNLSNSGQLNFTSPIHKNNTSSTRSISVTGTFNRPAAVTGQAYSVDITATDSDFSVSFTYPSFWVFTDTVSNPPTASNLIAGDSFLSTVTQLGNQTRTFANFVNNQQSVPRVFWLGVRSSAQQPTTFQTGANASLLSDVLITTSSINLGPETLPSGFVTEPYNLYGIILQPGNTYVRIF